MPKTGKSLKLKQQGNYPWNGDLRIAVEPKEPSEFEMRIRIPGWTQNKPVPSDLYSFVKESNEKVTLKVNGKPVPLNIDKGFARIRRKWQKGDVVTLVLPMPVRRVLSDERISDNKDRVALSRGPIVYCAEGIDNDGPVNSVVLGDNAKLKSEHRSDLLGGVTVLTGRVKTGDFTAIPYYAWANREKSPMTVWLARQEPDKP
jgi:DUF1680 family protein